MLTRSKTKSGKGKLDFGEKDSLIGKAKHFVTKQDDNMEERIMQALDNLKLQISKDIHDSKGELLDKIQNLSHENNVLKSKVSDLEQSLTFAHESISENEKKMKEKDKDLSYLKHQVSVLLNLNQIYTKKMENMKVELWDALNKQERYIREWNLRIVGIPEQKSGPENSKDLVVKFFAEKQLLGSSESDIANKIETAHRTGRAQKGKPRQIIVRFHVRKDRNTVFFIAKKRLEQEKKVRVVDDLTWIDRQKKKQAWRQMKDAYENGHKVVFRKGELFIDKKITKIVSAADQDYDQQYREMEYQSPEDGAQSRPLSPEIVVLQENVP